MIPVDQNYVEINVPHVNSSLLAEDNPDSSLLTLIILKLECRKFELEHLQTVVSALVRSFVI